MVREVWEAYTFSYTGIWLYKKTLVFKKKEKNFTFNVNFWWVKYIKLLSFPSESKYSSTLKKGFFSDEKNNYISLKDARIH